MTQLTKNRNALGSHLAPYIGSSKIHQHYTIIATLELYTLAIFPETDIIYLGNREADLCLKYKQGPGSVELTLIEIFHYPTWYKKSKDAIQEDLIKYKAAHKVISKVLEESRGLTLTEIEGYKIPKAIIEEMVSDAYVELFCQNKIEG